MSPDVKRICQSKECTRALMEDFFAGNSEVHEAVNVDSQFCCHNCDMKMEGQENIIGEVMEDKEKVSEDQTSRKK